MSAWAAASPPWSNPLRSPRWHPPCRSTPPRAPAPASLHCSASPGGPSQTPGTGNKVTVKRMWQRLSWDCEELGRTGEGRKGRWVKGERGGQSVSRGCSSVVRRRASLWPRDRRVPRGRTSLKPILNGTEPPLSEECVFMSGMMTVRLSRRPSMSTSLRLTSWLLGPGARAAGGGLRCRTVFAIPRHHGGWHDACMGHVQQADWWYGTDYARSRQRGISSHACTAVRLCALYRRYRLLVVNTELLFARMLDPTALGRPGKAPHQQHRPHLTTPRGHLHRTRSAPSQAADGPPLTVWHQRDQVLRTQRQPPSRTLRPTWRWPLRRAGACQRPRLRPPRWDLQRCPWRLPGIPW